MLSFLRLSKAFGSKGFGAEAQALDLLNNLSRPCNRDFLGLLNASAQKENISVDIDSHRLINLEKIAKTSGMKKAEHLHSIKSLIETNLVTHLLIKPHQSTEHFSQKRNLTAFLKNTYGLVQINLQDKTQWGTGIMIEKDLVLTSAHILYDNKTKSKYPLNTIQFSPGATGGCAPFPPCKVIDAYVPKIFEKTGFEEDYAILLLNQDIGSETGFIELNLPKDASLSGDNILIVGYIGDKPHNLQQTVLKGKIANVTDDMIDYEISTHPGQSGAGILRYNPLTKNNSLIGVHSWGRRGYGSGFKITKERLDCIKNWELKARNQTYDSSFDDESWTQNSTKNYGNFVQQSNVASLEYIENWRWTEAFTTGIPYCIDSAINPQLRSNIEIAIAKFIQASVKFAERSQQDCETNLPHIHFYLNDWSESPISGVGRTSNGPSPLILPSDSSVFAIMHEIMHTLGFVHEHQRTDRNLYVEVNKKVIEELDYVLEPKFYPIGSYDPESIMHYHWIEGEMRAREDGPISEQQRGKLKIRDREPVISKGDLAALKMVYGLCNANELNLCSLSHQSNVE